MALDAAPATLSRAAPGAQPVLALEGISKSFPGRAGAQGRALRHARRRGACAARRERRRQVDADQDHLRRAPAGQRRRSASTASRSSFASPHEAQRAGIATIYQELLLVPRADGRREHLHGPRAAHGGSARSTGRDARAGARRCSTSLDIHDLDVGAGVGTLSVGNRQRVEIAKALSQNARILIMDEPTAALTEPTSSGCSPSCGCCAQRGVGIVYISHRLEEIFLLADRVTVLRDGELRRRPSQVAETSRRTN